MFDIDREQADHRSSWTAFEGVWRYAGVFFLSHVTTYFTVCIQCAWYHISTHYFLSLPIIITNQYVQWGLVRTLTS